MLRGREDRYRKFQLHDLDMFKEVKTKVKKVEFASNEHQHHLHSPEIWPHMEWLTLSSALPSAIHVRACLLSRFSCVHLDFTLWTAAHQASPSMGFSRQEYWSGMPLPSPEPLWAAHKTARARCSFIHSHFLPQEKSQMEKISLGSKQCCLGMGWYRTSSSYPLQCIIRFCFSGMLEYSALEIFDFHNGSLVHGWLRQCFPGVLGL